MTALTTHEVFKSEYYTDGRVVQILISDDGSKLFTCTNGGKRRRISPAQFLKRLAIAMCTEDYDDANHSDFSWCSEPMEYALKLVSAQMKDEA